WPFHSLRVSRGGSCMSESYRPPAPELTVEVAMAPMTSVIVGEPTSSMTWVIGAGRAWADAWRQGCLASRRKNDAIFHLACRRRRHRPRARCGGRSVGPDVVECS